MAEYNDPRAVANYVLQTRRHLGLDTTNLELQKLLFFCHSNHLLATGHRLMSGHFEAWKYGPVHPIVYRAFKDFGGKPIAVHAEAIDPFTKRSVMLPQISGVEERRVVMNTVSTLSKLSAGQLVDLSHRTGGAWDETVRQAREAGMLGMRITDDMIVSCARRTKLVHFDAGRQGRGDFGENEEVRFYVEEPIAGYGSC